MSQADSVFDTDVVIRLVGESGEGTVSLGDLTVRILVSMGLDVYTYQTFPPEIRGGTVMYHIRAKSGTVLSKGDYADIVVVLNEAGFGLYGGDLREDGILLYDSDSHTSTSDVPGRTEIALPITTLAKVERSHVRHVLDADQLKRLPAPKNIVGLGALLQLVNAPLDVAEEHIQALFERKGEVIVRMNLNALRSGARHIAALVGSRPVPHVHPQERTRPVITVNGNQMVALGAVAGGMRFFAGYPITPASEIMEYLAKELPRFNGNLIQAEDEIGALAMAIGASFAGTRSMTASSGPGMSLMVEEINLAGQAEVPVVIVDVQRGGASTGMPTKTSQGDLNLAIYGVHNESPRIVMAAASVEDCFWTTIDALNLAEAYQCPVILLSDQALATHKSTVPAPDMSTVKITDRLMATADDTAEGYQRYRDTDTGISPMSIPGMPNGSYVSTGIEHNEAGNPGHSPELAVKMKQKRYRKLDILLRDRPIEFTRCWGDAGQVDVGIIAFGSAEGAVREATERARSEGFSVAHLHLRLLSPLPVGPIEEFAARCSRIIVAELNFTGQLAGWLRINTDIKFQPYHKDEGIPFTPNELYQQITRLAALECHAETVRRIH
ncbi:MAG: 2-oxoacid:acceptor oxidoreductase subunit alpha [Capsulimonadaceae bacterium]